VTDQQILDLLEDCKMQMGVRTIVAVVVTDRTRSPALFGFLRPRILLPQGLIETLSLDELHYVFLHELAHLKRRDIYLAWLVCLLQVLHWFNPLIWPASSIFSNASPIRNMCLRWPESSKTAPTSKGELP